MTQLTQQLKKALFVLLVAFLIYAMFKNPVRSAATVSSAWNGITSGVHALGVFFDALLSS